MTLPVVFEGGELFAADESTGELVSLRDASDHALVAAAERVALLDGELYAAKRALAAELRDRHGVGAVDAGGYRFTVAESQSWPSGATEDALRRLVASGAITHADANRAMPDKPTPDARALKTLISRLLVTDPEAAKALASACTVSPASVRRIAPSAVDEGPP